MIDTLRLAFAKVNINPDVPVEDQFIRIEIHAQKAGENPQGCDVFLVDDKAVLSKTALQDRGENNRIFIDTNAVLDGTKLIISGSNNILYFGAGFRIRRATITIDDTACPVFLGAGTTWESDVMICSRNERQIVVGEDCMFSNDLMITTDDSHGIFSHETLERINEPDDIVIGSHVWIGNGARVNKGSKIGDGVVLGAGSIASKNLEPNCVYAGVPARKLKKI